MQFQKEQNNLFPEKQNESFLTTELLGEFIMGSGRLSASLQDDGIQQQQRNKGTEKRHNILEAVTIGAYMYVCVYSYMCVYV